MNLKVDQEQKEFLGDRRYTFRKTLARSGVRASTIAE